MFEEHTHEAPNGDVVTWVSIGDVTLTKSCHGVTGTRNHENCSFIMNRRAISKAVQNLPSDSIIARAWSEQEASEGPESEFQSEISALEDSLTSFIEDRSASRQSKITTSSISTTAASAKDPIVKNLWRQFETLLGESADGRNSLGTHNYNEPTPDSFESRNSKTAKSAEKASARK
ncbi:uncharacterized protein L201_000079 [Kwoniella dendrophila CBS 6074]|uniref:Uncharacterized protein n=1 Tax=Kwoniella dendrophila CBS 6074 TaxID=1295534 RepID=A0AAX4JL29_9TREE